MGIPPGMLPHVFDLFTQGEWSADHAQGGMGIGLALVRRLVELHGGTITASSPGLGQGSEFVVRLPTSSLLSVRTPEPSRNGDGQPDSHVSKPAPRRILIVDDNVDAAESLCMLLSLEGHDIRLAHDGLTALRMAETLQPEVVLLDIGLPRMDGYEVARRLRHRPEMEKALLVALTGYGQDDDRRRSHEAGFNVHLVKPVDLDALRLALADAGSLVESRATT
jgi:two-component system CheB/CheR fusion protein